MNKHIRFLLAAGALASAGAACLHAEKTVKVTAPDGTPTRMALSTGTRISFPVTGAEIANPGEETVSIPYSRIQSISFDDTGLGVDRTVSNIALRVRRNPVESLLEVSGHNGAVARLSIASAGGARMIGIREWKGEPVDVSSLAPGIYILTIDNTSIKFIKK